MKSFKNLKLMFVFTDKIIKKIGARDHHHYCIITHGGKVINAGYNRADSFTFKGVEYRRHAECDALLKLPFKYKTKKLRMYVIRLGYKNSKPCQHCLQFIFNFKVKIKNIYYSDEGCLWDESLLNIKTEHISFKYVKN